MGWAPPSVTVERDELERLARELRSTAALLPRYDLSPEDASGALLGLRSIRRNIERVAVGAAERIERLLQEGT